MQKVLEWAANNPWRIGGVLSSPVFLANAMDATEEWRMARQVINGKFRQPSPDFDPEFCQFNVESIVAKVQTHGFLVGIVGLKATGKSSTLRYVTSRLDNAVYFGLPARSSCSSKPNPKPLPRPDRAVNSGPSEPETQVRVLPAPGWRCTNAAQRMQSSFTFG